MFKNCVAVAIILILSRSLFNLAGDERSNQGFYEEI
jgi:hypothetical protein